MTEFEPGTFAVIRNSFFFFVILLPAVCLDGDCSAATRAFDESQANALGMSASGINKELPLANSFVKIASHQGVI